MHCVYSKRFSFLYFFWKGVILLKTYAKFNTQLGYFEIFRSVYFGLLFLFLYSSRHNTQSIFAETFLINFSLVATFIQLFLPLKQYQDFIFVSFVFYTASCYWSVWIIRLIFVTFLALYRNIYTTFLSFKTTDRNILQKR